MSDSRGPWTGFEVAIVGMAARFPGARNVAEFWRNLRESRESISVFGEEELRAIQRNLRMQALLRKAEVREPPEVVLKRVESTCDYQALDRADFVVENVTEKWEVKRSIYQALDAVCPPACVFAANTSAIPITRIASVTRRPAQVLGMHFMNPVPLKPAVEVIRGFHTSDATLDMAGNLLLSPGKEAIVVNDSPGFVSNRVLVLTINEAIFLVQEQVASVEEIDRLFKKCFGHAMGPLETADLIGLDTILLSLEVLHESFGDSKYRPCPLLRRMVEAGLWGRKSDRGFYTSAAA